MEKEDLARQFDLLSRLLKVTRDNPFKIRTYEFAARTIRSNLTSGKLSSQDIKALSSIKGIGKAVVEKSLEFLHGSEIQKITDLRSTVPNSIYILAAHDLIDPEVLSFIWKDMGLTEPLEILEFMVDKKESLKLSQERLSSIEALLIEVGSSRTK
ncbi:MAG: DNA polymerase IV (family X)-like protein [Kosmotogaceae bacterium]|nr:DNA polymerase IV (family X)-like protein [Kosmotogaceae bacterium]